MNLLVWLIGFCVVLIAVTQFLVDGIKEWLPAKLTTGYEKVWALAVSLTLSLLAPVFFRSLPEDILVMLQIPAFLLVMPIIVRLAIGILISRGSEKFHDLLGPSAGKGNGEVSKMLYGDAEKPTDKSGRTNLTTILVSLTLISLLAGCGLFSQYANLKPLDKAIVTADRLAVWYTDTHKSVSDLYAQATPEKQLWYRQNVNPKLNSLKNLIVQYVDLVNVWKATGNQPLNLPDILRQVDTLTNDVLISLGKK